MKTIPVHSKCLVALLLAAAWAGGSPGRAADAVPPPATVHPPVNLIIDTDIGNAPDDVLALGVTHALESRGACRLLAVTVTNPDPLAGELVSAINTFYGRGDIPIGVNPQAPSTGKKSRYLFLAAARDERGSLIYPHAFDPAKAPSAVALLRRTLAGAEDGSVVIAQIGFFTNLAHLLESPPDEFSPLPGAELVRRKVRLLSMMAGAFGTVRNRNYFVEFNVKFDIASAAAVAEKWPTPTVWSGYEIGEVVRFPAQSIVEDFGYVPHHPIRETYQLFHPPPNEETCFDLTATLYAIWSDRGYFGLSAPGRVSVLPDGFTRFTPEKGGRDRFLTVTAEQAEGLRQLFTAFCSEPPAR